MSNPRKPQSKVPNTHSQKKEKRQIYACVPFRSLQHLHSSIHYDFRFPLAENGCRLLGALARIE